jgi:hypothetical protein
MPKNRTQIFTLKMLFFTNNSGPEIELFGVNFIWEQKHPKFFSPSDYPIQYLDYQINF